MSTMRTTITLDDQAYAFLAQQCGGNRSAFINNLLKLEKERLLDQAILAANREEAEDLAYQSDLSDWDTTLTDGLDG